MAENQHPTSEATQHAQGPLSMRSVAPDIFSSLPNNQSNPDPTMGPPEYLAGRPMSREAAAEIAKAERAVTGGRIERKGFAAQAQAAANEWAVGEDPVKEAPRGRRLGGLIVHV
eukprot:jgi/Chlat1/7093/Chrsp57S09121